MGHIIGFDLLSHNYYYFCLSLGIKTELNNIRVGVYKYFLRKSNLEPKRFMQKTPRRGCRKVTVNRRFEEKIIVNATKFR